MAEKIPNNNEGEIKYIVQTIKASITIQMKDIKEK